MFETFWTTNNENRGFQLNFLLCGFTGFAKRSSYEVITGEHIRKPKDNLPTKHIVFKSQHLQCFQKSNLS